MAGSYKSIAPKDSEGNRRLLSKYGGGSKGPRQPYATGGAVKRAAGGMVNMDDEEDDDMGASGMGDDAGMAEGDSAAPRLDRPGRKMHGKDKGKDKKGGTNVNVIIMPPGGAAGGPPPPGGPMPPMMAGPPPGPPPGPPMPPPGPGGPPMGMHATGGRVARASGGMVGTQSGKAGETSKYKDMEDTSKSYRAPGKGVMENMHDIGETPKRMYQGKEFRNQAQNSSVSADNNKNWDDPDSLLNGPSWRKGGGKVGRAMGGKAPVKMTDGAGGAAGRLEKIKKYGK